MIRFLVLLFLALLTAAEVAAVLALVDWLGPFLAMIVLALDVLAGLMVMRWAARGPAKDRGFKLTAGAFIALPGLVLDLVGVALLVPGIREWVRSSVMRGTESALRRSGISVVTVTATTDVFPGTVVDEETDGFAGTSQGPAAQTPGASQPPVIRGEIVSAEPTDGTGDTRA